eukprot:146380_1
MKRRLHDLTSSSHSQPPLKRRKVHPTNASTSPKRKYVTRVIGAIDIRSTAPDYCIEIKENNLYLQYYPNFYSSKQSKQILKQLEESVQYNSAEESSVVIFGKKHQIPRLQTAFGDARTSYKFSGNDVPSKPWNKVPLIQEIKSKIETHLAHKKDEEIGNRFNFCLVNRYKDGNDTIGFHKDDEKDLLVSSSIAGVSFGASRDIIFKHQDIVRKKKRNKDKESDPENEGVRCVKLELKSGSLFVIRHPTNAYWYHSIPKRAKIKKVRVSLTYRNMKLRDAKKK